MNQVHAFLPAFYSPGYTTILQDDRPYGDQIDRVVSWKSGTDVSQLAGKPVRLKVELKDADLYSFRFIK